MTLSEVVLQKLRSLRGLIRKVGRSPEDTPVRQDGVATLDSHSDCAIIITVHNHVVRFGLPCLESVLEHSGDARIYLYDNESSDPAIQTLENLAHAQPTVDFIRIDDQDAFGGLTGTWNDGVARARREGLNKVILLNHDVVVGPTWGSFISAIDSDHCIYGPLSNRPGGGQGVKGHQYATSATYNGLFETRKLLGFCMGFTLGRPEIKLFDDWRFFNPDLPFGNNEFGIQKRMKKRFRKSRFCVVTDAWVFHHLNMGWKDNSRYLDPHDPTPGHATPVVRRKFGECSG